MRTKFDTSELQIAYKLLRPTLFHIPTSFLNMLIHFILVNEYAYFLKNVYE